MALGLISRFRKWFEGGRSNMTCHAQFCVKITVKYIKHRQHSLSVFYLLKEWRTETCRLYKTTIHWWTTNQIKLSEYIWNQRDKTHARDKCWVVLTSKEFFKHSSQKMCPHIVECRCLPLALIYNNNWNWFLRDKLAISFITS